MMKRRTFIQTLLTAPVVAGVALGAIKRERVIVRKITQTRGNGKVVVGYAKILDPPLRMGLSRFSDKTLRAKGYEVFYRGC